MAFRARALQALAALAWGGALACAPRQKPEAAKPELKPSATPLVWAGATVSPQRGARRAWYPRACKQLDAGLERAAALMAERKANQGRKLELTEVHFALRSAGVPQVWPRVWTLAGEQLQPESTRRQLSAWLTAEPALGQTRCGVWQATGQQGEQVVVALAVDAVADLEPLPTQVARGDWLRLEAAFRSSAFDEGQVLLLGPSGLPQKVPTDSGGGLVRAAFQLKEAGLWRVQVGAHGPNGPRPVLEAWVFADREPYRDFQIMAAPGEEEWRRRSAASLELGELVYRMLNRARQSEGLAGLRRDRRLDRLAQAHAEAMRAAERTGHDVGNGPPALRVARAGLRVQRVGENVARAQSPVQAHRALWQSPSHRSTLLAGFDAVGVGVAPAELSGGRRADPSAPRGTDVWVCQLFVR